MDQIDGENRVNDSSKALARVRRDATQLYSQREVEQALDRMAAAIAAGLAGDESPIMLAVMTGGMIPAVWLSTRLDVPHLLDYVHASRYTGTTHGGELNWLARPRLPLAGRSVLIVDDILDEGITLKGIVAYCRQQGAAEVRTAVLVQKLHDRCVEGVAADYVGLEVPDRYVFGCGMDYQENFRDLTGIYALAPAAEEQQ